MEYALSSKCPYHESHHRKPVEVRSRRRSGRRPAPAGEEPTTSASAVRKDNELNSAQRRSAKRLQEYLQLKGAHGQGVVHSSGSTSEDAVELAQAEPGVRNAEAAHCEAEATGGAQERAADEASAYEHQPSPYKEQVTKDHTQVRRDRRTHRSRSPSISRRSRRGRLTVAHSDRVGPSLADSAAVGTRAPTVCQSAGVSSQGGTST